MIDINHEIERATIYFRDKAKREGRPALSRLYVILDHGGGWRFVITQPWEISFHPIKKERVIAVPKIRIAEPVEWEDIGRTITLAERYVTTKLATHNECGGCRACCTTMPFGGHIINDKPAHNPCPLLDSCTKGCRVYPVRPQSCRDFECEWLISQRVNDKMPPEMRPDRCGVIFVKGAEPETIEAHANRRWEGDPYEGEMVKEHLAALDTYGMKVVRK